MATHTPYVGTFELDRVPEWEREHPHVDVPTFLRRRCIPLLDGTDIQATSPLLHVRYRAESPVWTSEPPTTEAWYWVRPIDRDTGIPVFVFRDPSTGLMFWTTAAAGETRPVRDPDVLWSDRPLTEPV